MITIQYDNLYEKGDVVIFEKNERLMVGIITGYYVDSSAGDSIWYNITVYKDFTYTYINGGDIAEYSIIGKLRDAEMNKIINDFIVGKQD